MKFKKSTKYFVFFLCIGMYVHAQKIGYVDTKYLLENNQEYIDSKKFVKKQIEDWNAELKQMKDEYEKEKSDFLNEKILLTEEQIKEIEKNLEQKKKKINEFEKQKFGPDGQLIKDQLTIINPIQNNIWTTVQTIAKKRGLTMVFDKGNHSGPTIIYSDPKFDITTAVLEYMNDPKNKEKDKKKDKKEKEEEKGFEIDLDKELELEPEKGTKDKENLDKLDKTMEKVKKPVKTLSDKIREMQKNRNK